MTTSTSVSQERLAEFIAEGIEALPDRASASVVAVFLYGSLLGPAFRADSDIDVAVLDRADSRLDWEEVEVLNRGALLWVADEAEVARYRRAVLSAWERQPHPDPDAWSSTLLRLASLSESDS